MLTKTEFKELFDLYFDAIRSYIFYRYGDTEAASDMAQDVFMKVWEKRKELDASHIKPLLYKMAGDRLISGYRKQTSHLNFVQHMVVEDTPVSPIEQLQYEELKRRYEEGLNEITEKQREVFLMNRNEDLKYQEIAERLHISIKTVEKHMSGALQYLKRKLL